MQDDKMYVGRCKDKARGTIPLKHQTIFMCPLSNNNVINCQRKTHTQGINKRRNNYSTVQAYSNRIGSSKEWESNM